MASISNNEETEYDYTGYDEYLAEQNAKEEAMATALFAEMDAEAKMRADYENFESKVSCIPLFLLKDERQRRLEQDRNHKEILMMMHLVKRYGYVISVSKYDKNDIEYYLSL